MSLSDYCDECGNQVHNDQIFWQLDKLEKTVAKLAADTSAMKQIIDDQRMKLQSSINILRAVSCAIAELPSACAGKRTYKIMLADVDE